MRHVHVSVFVYANEPYYFSIGQNFVFDPLHFVFGKYIIMRR